MHRTALTRAAHSRSGPMWWTRSPLADDPASTFEVVDRTPRLHPDRSVVDAGFNGFVITAAELHLFDGCYGRWIQAADLSDLPESVWVRFHHASGDFRTFVEVQRRGERFFGRWLGLGGELFVPRCSRPSTLPAESPYG